MRIYKTIVFSLSILCTLSCSKKVYFEYYSKAGNILYLNNIENEFYIKSGNSKNIKVDISNALIEKKDDTTYLIKTDNKQMSEMKISDGSRTKIILFRKSFLPSPELTFRTRLYYNSKVMKVAEAKKMSGFSSVIQNFDYDLNFLSSSLEVIRIDSQQNITTETVVNSNRLSILQRAEVGDTYIFHNIRIEVSKDEIVDGKDLVIKIVE